MPKSVLKEGFPAARLSVVLRKVAIVRDDVKAELAGWRSMGRAKFGKIGTEHLWVVQGVCKLVKLADIDARVLIRYGGAPGSRFRAKIWRVAQSTGRKRQISDDWIGPNPSTYVLYKPTPRSHWNARIWTCSDD